MISSNQSNTLFSISPQQLDSLKRKTIPQHVAIIMDGNRRWSRQHYPEIAKQGFFEGHRKGAEVVLHLAPLALSLGIQTLTLYTFSTENKKRSEKEVSDMFSLIYNCIDEKKSWMKEQGIRFQCIGNLEDLPVHIQDKLQEASQETLSASRISLVLAINYGAKDELVRTFKKIHRDIDKGIIALSDVSESLVSSYLDTASFGDPDLLIRTGGEMRVSNFLLWQIAYTELYVTKVLWPDFGPKDFIKAIRAFQKRSRRGGL